MFIKRLPVLTIFRKGVKMRILWRVLVVIVLIAAIILVDKYPNLRKLLLAFVNRFDIFSYIYLPLGIIGVIVVLIRNVF